MNTFLKKKKDKVHKWLSFLGQLSGQADKWTEVKILPPRPLEMYIFIPILIPSDTRMILWLTYSRSQVGKCWFPQLYTPHHLPGKLEACAIRNVCFYGERRKGIKRLPLKLWNVWGATLIFNFRWREHMTFLKRLRTC